ncbi:MAG: methyltransferase domain-containing protein [Burkholderiaceae bacterium]|nr:methyltransferase domain-containing protein [Burkholderiaceae bacterium]
MTEVEACAGRGARSPAEVYDSLFVPALFGAWGPVLCDAADVGPGRRVLDVGCGTGAATLAAAARVSPGGAVVGLDANGEMLAVARRKRADVEWREGRAEALPFPDDCFDAVISQFALMLFDDAVAALREMRRVSRPGGRIAVAVCDAVEHSPGYGLLATMLDRLFGRRIGNAFRVPFALGDPTRLHALCVGAGLHDATVTQRDGTVCFASIDAMVSTERACVWTLGGLLDEAKFALLRDEARREFRRFAGAHGKVAFSMPALLIAARA